MIDLIIAFWLGVAIILGLLFFLMGLGLAILAEKQDDLDLFS